MQESAAGRVHASRPTFFGMPADALMRCTYAEAAASCPCNCLQHCVAAHTGQLAGAAYGNYLRQGHSSKVRPCVPTAAVVSAFVALQA
jgi:hypothetical protein